MGRKLDATQRIFNKYMPYAAALGGTALGLDHSIDGLENLVNVPTVVEQGLFWGGLGAFSAFVLKPIANQGIVNFVKSMGNVVYRKVNEKFNRRKGDKFRYETPAQLRRRRRLWERDSKKRNLLTTGVALGLCGLLSQGLVGTLDERTRPVTGLISRLVLGDLGSQDYKNMYRLAHADDPEMEARAERYADTIIANKENYKEIERKTGVDWYVVGTIHMLESGGDFSTYLHNGEPLGSVTKKVPRGIFFENWGEAAIHALERHYIENENQHGTLEALERYNGLGYRRQRCGGRKVQTPYLWSGTQFHDKGKYVRDGVFECNAKSKQPGAALILKKIDQTEDVRLK